MKHEKRVDSYRNGHYPRLIDIQERAKQAVRDEIRRVLDPNELLTDPEEFKANIKGAVLKAISPYISESIDEARRYASDIEEATDD